MGVIHSEGELESDSDTPSEFMESNNDIHRLSLQGKNLKSLDFLSKYMKFNPDQIKEIDFGENNSLEDK